MRKPSGGVLFAVWAFGNICLCLWWKSNFIAVAQTTITLLPCVVGGQCDCSSSLRCAPHVGNYSPVIFCGALSKANAREPEQTHVLVGFGGTKIGAGRSSRQLNLTVCNELKVAIEGL